MPERYIVAMVLWIGVVLYYFAVIIKSGDLKKKVEVPDMNRFIYLRFIRKAST